MDGSLPDLRGRLVALNTEEIALDQLPDCYWFNHDTSGCDGSDEDVELLNLVAGLLDEDTGDHIGGAEGVAALRSDPLVEKDLAAHGAAVAWRGPPVHGPRLP